MRRTLTTGTLCCLAAGMLSIGALGCRQPGGVKLTFIPADRTLQEQTVMREVEMFPPKVALIEVSGLLVDGPRDGLMAEGENPVSYVTEQLEKARKDPAVKAALVRVNSPGGTVTASQIIHDEILRFKEQTGKPVAAVLMDVAASGGYYVACAADRITAYPSSVTGSIGVIMQLFSLEGALRAIHVQTYAIKSGPFKDAGSPLRDLEPAERQLFQNIVDDFHSQFVMAVVRGRPHLDPERVRAIADGRVFTAEQALAAGLIDEIGGIRTALDHLRERTGYKKLNVVAYRRPADYKPNLYAAAPAATGAVGGRPGPVDISLQTIDQMLRPKFLYLWAPGLIPGS